MNGIAPMAISMAELANMRATTTRGNPNLDPRQTTYRPIPPLTRSPTTGTKPMRASMPNRRPPVPGTGMLLSSSHASVSTSANPRG